MEVVQDSVATIEHLANPAESRFIVAAILVDDSATQPNWEPLRCAIINYLRDGGLVIGTLGFARVPFDRTEYFFQKAGIPWKKYQATAHTAQINGLVQLDEVHARMSLFNADFASDLVKSYSMRASFVECPNTTHILYGGNLSGTLMGTHETLPREAFVAV